MPLQYYLAGPIFTPQEVFMFGTAAFLVISILVGAGIFLVRKLLNKTRFGNPSGKTSFLKSILLGLGVSALAILMFLIIPTWVKDANWERKQDRCAVNAGFKNRLEIDSNLADNLAEKQASYQTCLNTPM